MIGNGRLSSVYLHLPELGRALGVSLPFFVFILALQSYKEHAHVWN